MPAAAHSPMQAVTDLRVNEPRLLARFEALAEIGPIVGAGGGRGSSRLALTDDDRAGHDLVGSVHLHPDLVNVVPAKATTDDDVVAGADVLLQVALELAR